MTDVTTIEQLAAAADKNQAQVIACVLLEDEPLAVCERVRPDLPFPDRPYCLWHFDPRTQALYSGTYDLTLERALTVLARECERQAEVLREIAEYEAGQVEARSA